MVYLLSTIGKQPKTQKENRTMNKQTRLNLIRKLCQKPIGLFAPSSEDVREEISLVNVEREEREDNDSPFASRAMLATPEKVKGKREEYLLTASEKKQIEKERYQYRKQFWLMVIPQPA